MLLTTMKANLCDVKICLLLSSLCFLLSQVQSDTRNASEIDVRKVGTFWVELGTDRFGHSLLCNISTEDDIHELIDMTEDKEKVTLFEFQVKLKEYTYNPFSNVTGLYFKPWLWYTTKSQHGKTLLTLSFHYDVLSMNILTIGVKKTDLYLSDSPFGCFGNLMTSSQVNAVRGILLNRKTTDKGSSSDEFACNQVIEDHSGSADFVYNCCHRDPTTNKAVCSTQGDNFWINILYLAITSLKIMMFLFCPKFIPYNVYSAAYAASEYVVYFKKEIKMKLLISVDDRKGKLFKNQLCLEDISRWKSLNQAIQQMPHDEIIPVKISELKIKVEGDRIIPENDPPTGLLKTIYDNFFRCEMKKLNAFKECCKSDIYGSKKLKTVHTITWHQFVQVLVKTLILLLIPIPYYIRLIIYFKFEEDELSMRRAAMEANGLFENFNLYKTNVIQYFSPTHGVFIAVYIFYFLIGIAIGFTDQKSRENFKDTCRGAVEKMNDVSETGVIGYILKTMMFPFQLCGLLGFLIAPLYIALITPACVVIFVMYCLPTVYLTMRLPYYALTQREPCQDSLPDNKSKSSTESNKYKGIFQMHEVNRVTLLETLSEIDYSAHHNSEKKRIAESNCRIDKRQFKGFDNVKSALLQVITAVFCLCILYSIALVVSESIGLIVEVMAFTMMGMIVNAGTVFKYASMAILVVIYMNECYSKVYDNYLIFNKAIIDEISDRTNKKYSLQNIASKPASQQVNAAFQLDCVDKDKESFPLLALEKKDRETCCSIGQLLFFLDREDTPRIPLKMFQELCQAEMYGLPGPVYMNLLIATGRFMIIVVFLMFVMIVVMAFGNVHGMSSANTTLATLAGGFVPMLLRNVLSSRGAQLSLKTVSFKGKIDEIIDGYKQKWPVVDLVIKKEEVNNNDGTKPSSSDGGRPEAGNDKDDNINNVNNKLDITNEYKETSDMPSKHDDTVKGNGDFVKLDQVTLEEDENCVDLFIFDGDWSIEKSNENIPSESMIFLPRKFDPNITVINMEPMKETNPDDSPQPLFQRSSPEYQRKTMSTLESYVPLVVMYATAEQLLEDDSS